MLTGNTDSISNLVNIFTSLQKIKDEPKGVTNHPSIVKDSEYKIKPNLESVEVSRLKNIADILGRAWKIGDYSPKPEAGKIEDLTPDKQKSLGISAVKDKVIPIQKKDGLMGMLSNLLGALGLVDLKTLLNKIFETIKGKLGILFKDIGKKLWSVMKWIPQKLWSAMKWVGNKIWSGIKWLGDKLFNWADKIVDRIKGSKFYTGFMEKVATIKNGLKTVWDDVIKSIKGFVDDIIGGILKVKDAAFKALERVPGFNLVKKGVEVTTKGVARASSAVASGSIKVVGNIAKDTGKLMNTAKNIAKDEIGTFVSKLFKGGSSKIGSFLKNIPVLSTLIEGLFTANDIKNLKKEYERKAISLDDLRLKAGKRAVGAITSVGGATLGGAALSFIPGLGTVLGAVGGDFAGRYLGDLLVDNMISPNITKKLGAYITNTQELQDFVVKGDKIYPFNNKDELLSMKTGGAIDNLINSKSENTAPKSVVEHNKFAKTALIEQIKRQDTMIDLLIQLVRKPVGSAVINNKGGGGNNTPPSNFRDNFISQTLVTN